MTTVPGKFNTACFKDMVSESIDDNRYKDRRTNLNEERRTIIFTTAKRIKSEIRCTNFDISYYLTTEDLEAGTDILPLSLILLM